MCQSAALVAAVAASYTHGHALGIRQGEAEMLAIIEAEARRLSAGS